MCQQYSLSTLKKLLQLLKEERCVVKTAFPRYGFNINHVEELTLINIMVLIGIFSADKLQYITHARLLGEIDGVYDIWRATMMAALQI